MNLMYRLFVTTALLGCSFTMRLPGPGLQAAAQEVEMTAANVLAAQTSLGWTSSISAASYAVQSTPSLYPAHWKYAPPVDQWPMPDTNWCSTGTATSCFYRVKGVSRGNLLQWNQLDSFTTSDINTLLALYGLPATAVYDVTVYRLDYETFDHRDLAARASGAVAVPAGVASAPLLSYQHGTLFKTNDAPSSPNAADQLPALAFATEGYVVAMPDYLGLGGLSPPLHPYLHARSEAVAAVDMLRACRSFMGTLMPGVLNGKLFVAGYSQGGHATLALHRELEQRHPDEFTLTASAPMAGPYDLRGVMASRLLSDEAYANPAYVPYLILGLDTVYGFIQDPGDVFADPYAATVPPMFDGSHSASEINAVLPAVPLDMFEPAYVSDMTNDPNNGLMLALATNSLCDWAPAATTRLYHCSGDTVVPFENSAVAYSNFLSRGCTGVVLVDPDPAADHGEGVIPCLGAAKTWFDSLR